MADLKRNPIPGFRTVPRTGVIYVMTRAAELGFDYADPQWANLGQGSPETGPIPHAPARLEHLTIDPTRQGYAPVQGQLELRQKVADFYNHCYRKGKASQYTYENVSIASGGRAALTRLAAAMGNINLGHFLPDYTAYEELLSIFKAFTPIPILLDVETGYRISTEALKREILGRGLQAILLSNPCNPTGQLISGDTLRAWVQLARDTDCALILDEFYSHFIYSVSAGPMVSAAAYVDDVDTDPVILVDGLTKNWRYPGWRVSWTVGPKTVIEAIASAGSFLDGGANNPFQQQVVDLLDPALAQQETQAIHRLFRKKRAYVLERCRDLGIVVEWEPNGAFYVWANLAQLPAPINDGLTFFEESLKEKVITVPGMFFDVNPDHRRALRRYQNYCRISFGPEMDKLETGMGALARMIAKFR